MSRRRRRGSNGERRRERPRDHVARASLLWRWLQSEAKRRAAVLHCFTTTTTPFPPARRCSFLPSPCSSPTTTTTTRSRPRPPASAPDPSSNTPCLIFSTTIRIRNRPGCHERRPLLPHINSLYLIPPATVPRPLHQPPPRLCPPRCPRLPSHLAPACSCSSRGLFPTPSAATLPFLQIPV